MKMRLMVFSVTAFAVAATIDAKTVYVNCKMADYTGHDGSTPEKALRTIAEATDDGGKAADGDTVEVAVVIHGEAYKFFVQNLDNTQYGMDKQLVDHQEAIHKRLEEIEKKYHIHMDICMSGMHKKGILSEDLYPFVTPIKSAMVGLVKWQNAGYAYIPAH